MDRTQGTAEKPRDEASDFSSMLTLSASCREVNLGEVAN